MIFMTCEDTRHHPLTSTYMLIHSCAHTQKETMPILSLSSPCGQILICRTPCPRHFWKYQHVVFHDWLAHSPVWGLPRLESSRPITCLISSYPTPWEEEELFSLTAEGTESACHVPTLRKQRLLLLHRKLTFSLRV